MTKRGYKSYKPSLTLGCDILLAAVVIFGILLLMVYAEEFVAALCEITGCEETSSNGRTD